MQLISYREKQHIAHIQSKNLDFTTQVPYLSDCFRIVSCSIAEYFNANYVFSDFFYINNESKLLSLRELEKNEGKNELPGFIADGYNELKRMVDSKEVITITSLLMQSKQLGILIVFCDKIDKYREETLPILWISENDISFYNDGKLIDGKSGLIAYFKLSTDEIDKLIKNIYVYRRLFHDKGKTFLYFIRPITFHDIYNGSFMLLLKKPLLVSQIEELTIVTKDILSHVAMYSSQVIGAQKEWQVIADEQSHTLKHIYGALETNIKKIIDVPVVRKDESARFFTLKALKQVESLNKLAQFSSSLYRAGKDAENLVNIERGRSKELIFQGVRLQDILLSAVDTLEHSLDLLGFSDNEEGKREKVIHKFCIPIIYQDIANMKPIVVEVMKIGLEIDWHRNLKITRTRHFIFYISKLVSQHDFMRPTTNCFDSAKSSIIGITKPKLSCGLDFNHGNECMCCNSVG